MKKLKAIWHILRSDKFLCFTYMEGQVKLFKEYMTDDKTYIDKSGLNKYFFDSIDMDYNALREVVKGKNNSILSI